MAVSSLFSSHQVEKYFPAKSGLRMEGEGCVQEEREADQEEGAVVCEITTKDEITTKLKGEATTDDKLGMDLGRNIFIQSNFQKQKKYYQ